MIKIHNFDRVIRLGIVKRWWKYVTLEFNWLYRIKTMLAGLRSEAHVEVPSTCILSNGQLVSKSGQILFQLMRKLPHFSLDLLPQWTPDEIIVSIISFKSSSTQHDDHIVNCGPIESKIDNKAGHGYSLSLVFHSDPIWMSSSAHPLIGKWSLVAPKITRMWPPWCQPSKQLSTSQRVYKWQHSAVSSCLSLEALMVSSNLSCLAVGSE